MSRLGRQYLPLSAKTCRTQGMCTADIPARIKAARHLAGIRSAADLAARIGQKGIKTTRLNKIEQGRDIPTQRDLDAIAQACGLQREWFTADLSRIAEIAPDHTRTLAELLAEADRRQNERHAAKPSETQLRPAEGHEQ